MSNVSLANYLRTFPSVCPLCRRPLSAERDSCAKCGSVLQLGLKTFSPYLIAWGFTLSATVVVAGFGIFLTLLMLIRRPPVSQVVILAFWAICFLGFVMAAVSVGLLYLRRRFVRLPVWIQWVAALFAWGVTLFTALVFLLILR